MAPAHNTHEFLNRLPATPSTFFICSLYSTLSVPNRSAEHLSGVCLNYTNNNGNTQWTLAVYAIKIHKKLPSVYCMCACVHVCMTLPYHSFHRILESRVIRCKGRHLQRGRACGGWGWEREREREREGDRRTERKRGREGEREIDPSKRLPGPSSISVPIYLSFSLHTWTCFLCHLLLISFPHCPNRIQVHFPTRFVN